ncbi:MAG: protein-L-isoaspartate(D-aspartate) O-methyltransferase [Polyangiaceae bacterium]|nr:protein-L-isoaspartate(D-aspartate) O-methyltransferase [Polyangiaceae bacterium]
MLAASSAGASPRATPPPAAPAAEDAPEARLARDRLVRSIEIDGEPWEKSGPWDPRVLAAMRSVPRHQFMPGATLRQAYMDTPRPIGHEQTISQPTVVAIMSQALSLHGTERVLEIGTGSGDQAAILSVLAREVFTIEIIPELGEPARSRLAALGYRNVEVRIGDGYKGWPERAPFDRILLTAAPPEIPEALVEQLAEGGILVAPVGDAPERQRLVRWTKVKGALKKEDLGAVRFVPMVREEDRGDPPR